MVATEKNLPSLIHTLGYRPITKAPLTILFFFADWCEYCKGEMGKFSVLYGKYKSCGLDILGVSLDTSDESLKKIVKDFKIPFPIVQDRQNLSRKEYQLKALPHFIILNKSGKILTELSGTRDIGDFYRAVYKTFENKKCVAK